MEKDFKSVLVFYSIEDESIFNMSIKDIWTDYIIAKKDGVRCTNVFHFEFPAELLMSMIKDKEISEELFSSIKSEYDLGANVMFINPVVGSPLDCYLLKNFLLN